MDWQKFQRDFWFVTALRRRARRQSAGADVLQPDSRRRRSRSVPGAGVDVGACQTPAEKFRKLVGLETSAGRVSSA